IEDRPEAALNYCTVTSICVETNLRDLAAHSPERPAVDVRPGDTACLIWSPEQVSSVPRVRLGAQCEWFRREIALAEGDAAVIISPMLDELFASVLSSLLTGGCAEILPRDASAKPDMLRAALQRK